jgi:membrane protein required for colicin V production
VTELAWVDLTLLGVLLVSTAVGLLRGFVFELLSLLGWIVAWGAATFGAPWVATNWLRGWNWVGTDSLSSVSFALCFVAALVVWGLLAKLISLIVQATPLNWPDRGLGAVFGLVRGLLGVVVVVAGVNMSPWAQAPAWQASLGARVLGPVLENVIHEKE